jgi:CRP-like cAMP-binding protein
MAQGQAARGVFLFEGGEVQVEIELPGGERLVESVAASGRLFGEASLLEGGTHPASIRAATSVRGVFVERRDFGLLTQSTTVEGRAVDDFLIESLSVWLDSLNQFQGQMAAPGDLPYLPAAPELAAENKAASSDIPFQFREFLPILPVFKAWDSSALEELTSLAEPLAMIRGEPLFFEGMESGAAYVTLHGALEVSAPAGSGLRRLAVLGPGQILGYRSVIEGGPRKVRITAREDALVLRLSATRFMDLWRGPRAAGRQLREAVRLALLGALQKTTQELARRANLARILAGQSMR